MYTVGVVLLGAIVDNNVGKDYPLVLGDLGNLNKGKKRYCVRVLHIDFIALDVTLHDVV